MQNFLEFVYYISCFSNRKCSCLRPFVGIFYILKLIKYFRIEVGYTNVRKYFQNPDLLWQFAMSSVDGCRVFGGEGEPETYDSEDAQARVDCWLV